MNQNQFNQTRVVGELDLRVSQNQAIYSCRIDPDSATEGIVPGTGVILKDGGSDDANGLPLVDVRTGDTDAIFGTVIYSTKKSTFLAGSVVQIAVDNSVIIMAAKAAALRGAVVSLEVATPGNVQAVASNTKFGILLDKASAAGDLVRVKIERWSV